jgi:hypothetical protein
MILVLFLWRAILSVNGDCDEHRCVARVLCAQYAAELTAVSFQMSLITWYQWHCFVKYVFCAELPNPFYPHWTLWKLRHDTCQCFHWVLSHSFVRFPYGTLGRSSSPTLWLLKCFICHGIFGLEARLNSRCSESCFAASRASWRACAFECSGATTHAYLMLAHAAYKCSSTCFYSELYLAVPILSRLTG